MSDVEAIKKDSVLQALKFERARLELNELERVSIKKTIKTMERLLEPTNDVAMIRFIVCNGNKAKYVVEPGDTLSGIAAKIYGEAWMWNILAHRNPQIENPDYIQVGWVIDIPGVCWMYKDSKVKVI